MGNHIFGFVLIAFFLSAIIISSDVCVFPVNALTYGPLSGGNSNFGGVADDAGFSIKLTRDTGLIFAGYTKSFGNGGSDLWLLKTGLSPYTMQNGVTGAFQREQWNVTFGGAQDDGAYSVIQTADGGYAVAGFTYSYGAGGSDAWLVKTAADGTLQWTKTFGGPYNDAANCILQTNDAGYLIVGYTSDVSKQSTWAIKTDSTGTIEWTKTFSGKAANSVIATRDGGNAFAVEYDDSFGLIKINSSGDELINMKYEPSAFKTASAQSLVEANDGGYIIIGWINSNDSSIHYTWMVKTNSSGELQWSKTLSDLGAADIIKIANGGYALTGDRAFLILTDAEGNIEWNKINDGNPSNDTRYATLYPTNMQSIIEASPNHFVMTGSENGGEYVKIQVSWVQVALKSGEQTYPPQTTILSPTNTIYNQRNLPLTFYVNESTKYLAYNLNGLTNKTINGNMTLTNLPNGDYSIRVYATDQDLNHAVSQTVLFTIKSTEPYTVPLVTIESPKNQIYNTTQITLTFSVDQEVAWTAFSLDGHVNQTTFPNNNMSFFAANGEHTLTVYAGQRQDAAGSATINFTVNAPQPTIRSQPYPPVNSQTQEEINAFLGSILGVFSSSTFLIVASVFLVAAICLIIALLLIAKRMTKKEPNQA